MSTEFFSLVEKRVLVTGGGRGLGRAMAQGLAQAEGTVVVLARTHQQVEDAAQEIGAGAVGLAADIGEEDPKELVDRAQIAVGGPIDVVLHAAGVQHRQPAENFDPEVWDRVLRINLTAPFPNRDIEETTHQASIAIPALFGRLPEVNMNDLVRKGLSLHGSYGYSARHFTQAAELIEENESALRRRITAYSLDQAPQALAATAAGEVIKALVVFESAENATN